MLELGPLKAGVGTTKGYVQKTTWHMCRIKRTLWGHFLKQGCALKGVGACPKGYLIVNVEVFEWPSYFPDLNIIGNLWVEDVRIFPKHESDLQTTILIWCFFIKVFAFFTEKETKNNGYIQTIPITFFPSLHLQNSRNWQITVKYKAFTGPFI